MMDMPILPAVSSHESSCISMYVYMYTCDAHIYVHVKKPCQNGRKMTSFRGATAALPSWELA